MKQINELVASKKRQDASKMDAAVFSSWWGKPRESPNITSCFGNFQYCTCAHPAPVTGYRNFQVRCPSLICSCVNISKFMRASVDQTFKFGGRCCACVKRVMTTDLKIPSLVPSGVWAWHETTSYPGPRPRARVGAAPAYAPTLVTTLTQWY